MSVTGMTGSSGMIRDQYLTLLVEQLKNQDPLDPMKNDQMTSQLAQLSQLEQMEYLNQTFEQVLTTTQMNQATSLIGSNVAYLPDGAEEPVVGKVQGATIEDGRVMLELNTGQVGIADILALGATGGIVGPSDLSTASSLIGKTVTFEKPTETGTTTTITETVRSVEFSGGRLILHVGDYNVDPSAVVKIQD